MELLTLIVCSNKVLFLPYSDVFLLECLRKISFKDALVRCYTTLNINSKFKLFHHLFITFMP